MLYPVVIRISQTEKMPCPSYSLRARTDCHTGGRLALVAGSVCSECYAAGGRYLWPSVNEPREWNAAVWAQCEELGQIDLWVDAMVQAITKRCKKGWFRWFDAGDIRSLAMLRAIVEVCERTPSVNHWLPTHETGILRAFKGKIPSNLTIRKSADMIGWIDNTGIPGILSSSVGGKVLPSGSEQCKAYTQGGKCLDCRSCWDQTIQNINYPLH